MTTTPTPLKSEVLVTVITSLGIHCGSFVYPKNHLHHLDRMNEDGEQPFYFRWQTNGRSDDQCTRSCVERGDLFCHE